MAANASKLVTGGIDVSRLEAESFAVGYELGQPLYKVDDSHLRGGNTNSNLYGTLFAYLD